MFPLATHDHTLKTSHVTLLGGDFKVAIDDTVQR